MHVLVCQLSYALQGRSSYGGNAFGPWFMIYPQTRRKLYMKTLLSISLLAIVAMTLAASAIAQPPPHVNPPQSFTWKIALVPPAVDSGSGTAQYTVTQTPLGQTFRKFSVECEYLDTPSPSQTWFDVFVKKGNSVGQYGKLVGSMQLVGGYGELVLLNEKAPIVTKGTMVFILHDGFPVMTGSF